MKIFVWGRFSGRWLPQAVQAKSWSWTEFPRFARSVAVNQSLTVIEIALLPSKRWVFTDTSIKHFFPADDGCWVSLNPWEILRFYSLASWAAQCPETLNVCFTMCRILSRLLQWFHTSFMKIVSVTVLCYEGWHSVSFARSLLLCPLL